MTDHNNASSLARIPSPDWADPAMLRRMKRRKRGTTWLKFAGIGAISLAILMLLVLIASILVLGRHSVGQTMVTVDVFLDPALIDSENLDESDWRGIRDASIASLFPADASGPRDRTYRGILAGGRNTLMEEVRTRVAADPGIIGETIPLTVPVADPYDQLSKGIIDADLPEDRRRVNDRQIAMFNALVEEGRISTPPNWGLFTNPDSRFPEIAGLKGALIGSAYALLVCFLISFPVGIAAAVYLEEFAPKNWFSDIIEVNINNLAAVPSIVFGLLGLAVFLNFFGLPRSAPLVGGMVLALMTLPTIIIATRASLKAVPPSIREGALGIGASPVQVITHHVLPLAMPGILTGTIIGLAQALGETAPLLLIGMNTFITAAPESIFDQSTALPTQIYIWFDSPERGFISRTAAAIVVLLGFLLMMNALAIFLRSRLERSW